MSRWVSVDDELPKDGQLVLYAKECDVGTPTCEGVNTFEYECFADYYYLESIVDWTEGGITIWMPIEHPKENIN